MVNNIVILKIFSLSFFEVCFQKDHGHFGSEFSVCNHPLRKLKKKKKKDWCGLFMFGQEIFGIIFFWIFF